MKKYNYFYDGAPISKRQFESEVPENWQEEVQEDGTYSYGLYRANELDEEMNN